MDFIKFMEILENKALFFPRLSTLKDPFEGHPPRHVIEVYKKNMASLKGDELEQARKIANHSINVLKSGRNLLCVSCWHNNKTESAGMWDIYSRQGEGIAIKTTIERFKNAFKSSNAEVNGGLVDYVDYDNYKTKEMNVILWATLKRFGFDHEREFRGIIMDGAVNSPGLSVSIDVDTLIEDVYVSPLTPEWHIVLIEKMLIKYGLKRDIKQSKLNEHPMYYEMDNPSPE